MPSTATTPMPFPLHIRDAGAADQIRRRLDFVGSPVEALRALRPLGAVLLESRTEHPGARYSILPFSPLAEISGTRDRLVERRPGTDPRFFDDPWPALGRFLKAAPTQAAPDPLPFSGGWVGVLSHEASAWILGTPMPAARPPARPELPWAFFRLYSDALVIDHARSTALVVANHLNDVGDAPAARLDRAVALLRNPPGAAPAPHAEDDPVASMDLSEFRRRVLELQTLIRDGDCFQANLTTSFAYPWRTPPDEAGLISLYDEYASANPGPWGAYYDLPGATLLSASPELLALVEGDRLQLRPIAGTRRRGASLDEDERLAHELRTDEKEQAEHAMLVDLARNDAASVCRPGTVQVPNLGGVERYRHVMHLVSEVEGRLDPGRGPLDVLAAVFPGGTVTGCPKRRAVQRIAELEGGPRGPYTGTLGYVSLNGNSQWNLLIRTLVATPTHLVAHAGCGIVEGSRADAEAAELEAKARAQVEAALGRARPAPVEARCGHVEPGPAWSVPAPTASLHARRVLVVDFEDSFVHNLADYCRRLGASTRVVSAHAPAPPAWEDPPTHLVLSPGPGRPEDFPSLQDHLEQASRAHIPVLGVCLGHQGIAQILGANVRRHPETVHGKARPIRRLPAAHRDAILGGWKGDVAARYHSLIVEDLPQALEPLAQLVDGTCMAYRHRERPWWGLQFHPESLLTQDGLSILQTFLEVGPR